MEKAWRLILDHKNDGYYNMAVDEAIFMNYSYHKIPTLRIYGWSQPFITLGYNQNPKKVLNSGKLMPFVRRITGGLAILHDQEITYSMSCSLNDLDLPQGVKESYKVICSFLKYFYKQFGLQADFADDMSKYALGQYGNFCFGSCLGCDLVIENKKIGGNAQCRRKNIIFQHGSIPQEVDLVRINKVIKDTDAKALNIASLNGCLDKSTDFYNLRDALKQSFESNFGIDLKPGVLFGSEVKMKNDLLKNKYLSKAWNFKDEEAYMVK